MALDRTSPWNRATLKLCLPVAGSAAPDQRHQHYGNRQQSDEPDHERAHAMCRMRQWMSVVWLTVLHLVSLEVCLPLVAAPVP